MTIPRTKARAVKKLSPSVQLIIAAVLFGLAVLLSRGSSVSDLEIAIFEFVYGLPSFLRPLFFVITQTGSIHMLGLLLAIYLVAKKYHVVIRLLMSGALAYLLAGVAKDLWGRGRPVDFLENIVNLDYVVRGPGFPSGHTAMATALALTMSHYLPRKYNWLIAVWIVGVGVSRLYLGIHFPMDILGGFSLGWISYALFRHVRLYDVKFKKQPSSKR